MDLFPIKSVQVAQRPVVACIQGKVSSGSSKDGSLQMLVSATPSDFSLASQGSTGGEDPPLHLEVRGKYTSV